MKPKPIRLYFRVAMMLLMLLTTMTAWATDETKTFTISNASGSGTITYGGNDFLVPVANMMTMVPSGGSITMRTNTGGNEGTVKLYPRISGKVKSLTFSSARVMFSDVVGTEHYVKIGKGDIWTNSYTEDMNTATALTFTFTNVDGLQLANEDDYLEIKMRNSETTRRASFLISGTLTITYEPTASTLTHTHNFSYNAVGNTLTATCAHDDGKECNLASSSYQISTSLMAPTFLIFNDGWNYPASMSGFEGFRSETKATIGSITYIKTDTNEDYGTSEPNATGTYTASVTITAGGTGYTLQTSYRVTDYHFVYNNYPQFTITTDKSGNYAGNGQTVTITFTPKFGETLTGLTVTGATTNYSSGSGITDNGSNTYTFIMPGEDVTIGATFSISEDDFAETGTNEYTIKTANGWGWFCFAVNNDLAPDGFSGKTVKLGTSIGSSEMAGTSGHPFRGTFDGQGNTLTFNLQASKGHSAPFHYTDGATISNLHVEGTITGGDNTSLGGLVGYAVGNITIENCHVSTQISTTHSGAAWHGGVIAFWYDSNVACTVTGCVYDGLIYNPSEADATTYCRGFIGNLFGSNLTVTFTDCLYAPAAYGTGKNTLGDECNTFVYPNSSPTYNMTNCYYTRNLGRRQGRPAATATVAPANLGAATTDHGIVDGYKNGFLYDGNYYTPKYGDVVVEYPFDDDEERASVTINGEGNNLVGVNITEDVGKVSSVTYNRSFSSGKAATVILPFNYICNGSEGGKFFGFKEVTYDDNQHIWVCTMVEPGEEGSNNVTSLTANTPYLFMPEDATMAFPNIVNMTGGVVTLLPTTANDGGNKVAEYDGWELRGTYTEKVWEENDPEIGKAYLIGDGGELIPVTAGTKIRPTECYIIQTKKRMDGKDITVSIPAVEWTGSEVAFDASTVKVWDGTTLLTQTTDYTVTAPTGTLQDTGDYPVTITGAGNYAGSREVTFTIMPAKIANATIQFSASSFEYNGSPIKPELTLMDGATEVPNTEYTVSYADNVNAGTATVTIEDLPGGNYALASVSKTYEIGKKTVGIAWSTDALTYNGTEQAPTATATGLVGEDECIVTVEGKHENAGSGYVATATALSNDNYKLPVDGLTQTFDIASKTLTDQEVVVTITKNNETYEVSVTHGEKTLVENTDYTLGAGQTSGNDYNMPVTGKGNYTGVVTATYVNIEFEKPADAATDADCCAAAQVSQDMALPEGMVAVMLTGTDPQKGIASAKTLDYIPAGVPVILMKKDDVDGFTGKDITPGATSGTTEVTDAEKAACPLKVADGNTENLQGYQDYVWFKGELVMVSNTAKPANGTFYVKNSTPNSAPRLQIVIGEEEVTTSLTPNPSPKGEGSGYWYTLDGQKMDKKPTKKGLYIHNGKKTVIK